VLNKNQAKLDLNQLPDRLVPTVAIFSNATLTVLGDNSGNNIDVSSDANGNLQVTERGAAVTITGSTTATTANTKLVVERAGTGANNTLTTDASLGSIPDSLIGGGTGTMTFNPGNNAPSTAFGSRNATAHNVFTSNPGGKDTFFGGAGENQFVWLPGTGTDTYIGAGRSNTVTVVGNNNGTAENDSLQADGTGGVTYSRNNLVPFNIYTTGIQNWDIKPSTGTGNMVTVGDLTGTSTKRVEVDATQSFIDASGQNDAGVTLVVRGPHNTVAEGAGPTVLNNKLPA
jgi:hypothetical protein